MYGEWVKVNSDSPLSWVAKLHLTFTHVSYAQVVNMVLSSNLLSKKLRLGKKRHDFEMCFLTYDGIWSS